jgi:mannose-6-phosphate isomerase-like protein (cupin superfamily)
LAVSIGYAHVGVDEPHLHMRIREVYLIARGSCRVRVEQETVNLMAGDVLIVEPGEAHTFLEHSTDYFHFVLHVPGLAGDEACAEKFPVELSRLGDEPLQ